MDAGEPCTGNGYAIPSLHVGDPQQPDANGTRIMVSVRNRLCECCSSQDDTACFIVSPAAAKMTVPAWDMALLLRLGTPQEQRQQRFSMRSAPPKPVGMQHYILVNLTSTPVLCHQLSVLTLWACPKANSLAGCVSSAAAKDGIGWVQPVALAQAPA